MGRTPPGLNRGPWTRDEDLRLKNYIEVHGEGGWRTLPIKAGLLRCGKSCRLRWMNYLRPDVKCGHILPEEEDLILRLHRLLGNRWALIAGRIPGRTDNEIKNYWNTHLSKKLISQGIDPRTHKHLSESEVQGTNHGDRETSKISQRKTNASADLQPVSSKRGRAITVHGNEDYGKAIAYSANNVNQLPETSPTCNPQPASVAINCSSQTSGIPSTAYAFQETIFNNMGTRQIPYPPSPITCFDSLLPKGTDRYDLDQYLMKNPVTSNNNMITSTLRLNSALQAPSFLGQLDSNHAFTSANAFFYNEKHQTSLQVSDIPASSTVPDEITTMSYNHHISPVSVAAALGDFNSDVFCVLQESFVREELHFRETDAHTSMPQNVQLCPLNQPESADLTDDLWSMLSPSSQ